VIGTEAHALRQLANAMVYLGNGERGVVFIGSQSWSAF
jgi:hypothetical protein